MSDAISSQLLRQTRLVMGRGVTGWTDTELVTIPINVPAVLTQAFTFALDPTPKQTNAMRSHDYDSRSCYNALLGLSKDNWDENHAKRDAGLSVTKDDYDSISHFGLLEITGRAP